MRTPILAGNWKMNKTVEEALAFIDAVREPLAPYHDVGIGICAPAVTLYPLAEAVEDTAILLGAQNMHWQDSGAYTGEIAPPMLADLVRLVIIGHSERREYYGETDETVNKKIKAAVEYGLTPIVCVGENLETNEAGETESFVRGQVEAGFDGVDASDVADLVIAYEPIWAIGTGKAATPEEANRIIGEVRGTVATLYDDETAQSVRIQYGGSMKPANCEELMKQPEIDGGLVGGASLTPESFVNLVKITADIYG